jgi:hypothetical protein
MGSDRKVSVTVIPLLNAINAQIDPPDARNTQHRPEYGLLAKGADGKP